MTTPTITVAATPTTADFASQILAMMAARSGVLSDYNVGSQIRTISEANGAVVEQQGISAQARAFQALVYSAMSLFQITPVPATPAVGTVTFATDAGSPPPASQSVPIPSGTIVQTTGGIQFKTVDDTTLVAGQTSVDVVASASVAGTQGNVPAGAITFVATGLIYPLFVTNAAPMAGGRNAQSSADAMARFTAAVAAIGLSSPVAIANAAIGVAYGAETVRFSTLFEPGLAAGSGVGSGDAGWKLVLDNGAGSASSGLIAAVNSKLNGGTTASGASNAGGDVGYRDAGVPYSVVTVSPTYAVVGVSGTILSAADHGVGTLPGLVSGAIAQAVSGYFTLPFGKAPDQAAIAAAVANATLGQLSSLAVALYASGSSTPLETLPISPSGRALLGALSITLASGV